MIRPEDDLVAAEKHPLKICAPKALFLYQVHKKTMKTYQNVAIVNEKFNL